KWDGWFRRAPPLLRDVAARPHETPRQRALPHESELRAVKPRDAKRNTIPMAIINGTNAGDFITGTQDGDTIVGQGGDDTIVGGHGNDFAVMGAGNDQFVWNPGDGSDTVLGGCGFDTLVFNGADINEQFGISVVDGITQLTRDVGGVTMTLDSVERIELATLGGSDVVHIGDLGKSATPQVAIDLGNANGAGGAGAADTVIADGSDANDRIHVAMA